MKNWLFIFASFIVLVGCSDSFNVSFSDNESINPGIDDAFNSTYKSMDSQPVLLKSANIYDGLGGEFINYDLLLSDGKIIEINKSIDPNTN